MPPQRPAMVAALKRVPGFGKYALRTHDAWLRSKILRYWDSPNSRAQRLHEEHPPRLTGVQQQVLDGLAARGIARLSFDDLFEERKHWDRLGAKVQDWLASDEVRKKERDYLEGGHRAAR